MSDMQDDLRAAFNAAADGNGTPPALPSDNIQASPKSEVLPPVQPDPRPGQAPRGADGKFAAAPGAAPAASGEGLGGPAIGAATPTPDSRPAPGVAAPGAPATGLALDPTKPPSAWTPGMKAKWGALPEDVRAEVTRREEASARGVSQLKQHYEPMENLYRNVVAPHQEYFDHIERDPTEYFGEMVHVEQTLALGNPAQKMQALLDLADQYGIPVRQTLDTAMNGKLQSILQQAHKAHGSPPMLPPEVARELQMYRNQQQHQVSSAADYELNEFIGDGTAHPFFDEVKDLMADLIENGMAQEYEDAYEMAVWQSAGTRQKMIARQNGQSQAQGIANRQAAAARIATPGAAPVVSATVPNADESMEDTIRKAWVQAATPGV